MKKAKILWFVLVCVFTVAGCSVAGIEKEAEPDGEAVNSGVAERLTDIEEERPTEKEDSLGATQIITFYPTGLSGDDEQGHCWTNSMVANRPDAWRCDSTGYGIQDPCFSIPDDKSAVICGADPLISGGGYRMVLMEPLPEPSSSWSDESWWILELENGGVCRQIQGTALEINGEYYDVPCGSGYLEDIIIKGDQWIAVLVRPSSGSSDKERSQVVVKTVWR